jgi:ribonuclease VapC
VIVDSSAIVAKLHKEPGFERIVDTLLRSETTPRMGSPTFVETSIVIDRKRDPALTRSFETLIDRFGIEIVPFTPEHARLARQAYRDFGKGNGHPAKLNFGDAMAYALAQAERAPLLFVGVDFTHTDIEAA